MIRVRVTQTWGSTPREVGAEMFVTPTGSTGTIGGGRLEFDAIARARQQNKRDWANRHKLKEKK